MLGGLRPTSLPRGQFIINSKAIEDPSMLYNPIVLPWLPKSTKSKTSETGIFEMIQAKFSNSKIVIGLLDLSLPQFIAAKYHRMDVEVLGKEASRLYAAIMTWYAQYCQVFGLGYLRDIQEARVSGRHVDIEQSNVKVSLNVRSTRRDVTSFALMNGVALERLGKVTKLNSTPQAEHCITKSVEFLLEPCVLVQLPWNTTVLHQWLVLAMLDTLTFEKYTLELRHWPLLQEVDSAATSLLFRVRMLKERLMLGFLILCRQIRNVPEQHAEMIMDHVVLPSLPTLQFIQPGKQGHKILQSIKMWAWSKPRSSTPCLQQTGMLYRVVRELQDCFDSTCYGLKYWLQSVPVGFYHPDYDPKSVDIVSVIGKLGSSVMKDLVDETRTWQLLLNQCDDQDLDLDFLTAIAKIDSDWDVLLKTIDRDIVKKGRIPEQSPQKIESAVRDSGDFDSMMKQASIINKCQSFLRGHASQTGLLRRIVLVQLERVERDQMIKLTGDICLQLGTTPVDINADKYRGQTKVMSVAQMNNKVLIRSESQVDRRSLLLQFDPQWRQPLKADERLSALTKRLLTNRIGRIIVNVAGKVYGGGVFRHWLTVQYLLPCYMARLVAHYLASQDKAHQQRVVALVEGLLQQYEHCAEAWCSRSDCELPQYQREWQGNMMERVTVSASSLRSILGHVHLLLTSHMGPPTNKLAPHFFFAIKSALLGWHDEAVTENKRFPGFEYLDLWLCHGSGVIRELDGVCAKVWNYPNMQRLQTLRCVEMYELDQLMSFFMVVAEVMRVDLGPPEDPEDPSESLLCCRLNLDAAIKIYQEQLFAWRVTFITAVLPGEGVVSKARGLEILKKIFFHLRASRTFFSGVSTLANRNCFWKVFNVKLATLFEMQKKLADMSAMESWLFSPAETSLANTPARPPANISAETASASNVSESRGSGNIPETSVNTKSECGGSGNVPEPREKVPITKRAKKPPKKCRNCKKPERFPREYVACRKCLTDKYPDVNYFCTERCGADWWKTEHMAEHLEFELGLSVFNKK